MAVSLPTLDGPAILVADGGASAHAPDHSLEAFRLATRLGATGLGLDVLSDPSARLVVARRRSRVLRGPRWRRADTAEGGERLLLSDLLAEIPSGIALGARVEDRTAFDALIQQVSAVGRCGDLWCRHSDLDELSAWSNEAPEAHFVFVLHAPPPAGSLERQVAQLRAANIDALEMRATNWTSGHVALAHRFGRHAWATDADHPPVISRLLLGGLDAVVGRNVEHLVDTAGAPHTDPR